MNAQDSNASGAALRYASECVQELLVTAGKTAELLAESMDPCCAPETRASLAALAQRYAQLVAAVRATLVEQAALVLGPGAATDPRTGAAVPLAPAALVGDASLAARTEAEIAARKALVLARRLECALPCSTRSSSGVAVAASDTDASQPPML